MTPQEEKQIRHFGDSLRHKINLSFFRTEDPRSQALDEFCRAIKQLVPQINITPAEGETGEHPAILVGPQFRYRGVPAGNELEPFLEAVSLSAVKHAAAPAALKDHISDLHPPVDLQLYVAPSCHFCPGVLRQLLALPFASPAVYLTVIDGILFDDLASGDGVRSVPTTILDQQYRWTGGLEMDQLIEAFQQRDPAKAGRATLERFVLEGGAVDLARMMIDRGRIFPALLDLLVDENFSVRLAAMVTIETLAGNSPGMASGYIEPLWEKFSRVTETVKGDILYLFGEIGAQQCLPYLKSVLKGSYHPEVLEAAEEALEKFKQT